jgi:endoglucanase
MAPFDEALRHARELGLGVVLDMHVLPGAAFDQGTDQNTVFVDLGVQAAVAELWHRVAARYAQEGPWLRFEILNEPVAPSAALLNTFQKNMLAAIRRSDSTRVVYLTSNRWSSFDTVPEVEVVDDPYVAFTFHFYKPMLFTHQGALWAKLPLFMPSVSFPGAVPDLTGFMDKKHYAWVAPGVQLTIAEQIDEPFAAVASWAATEAAGHEIYIGEFGVYDRAEASSRRNYVAAVRAACERHGFGWAVWTYMGGFAVRDPNGRPTAVLLGLFSPPAAR